MAERRIISPDQIDLDSPGRRDYFIKLSHPTAHGHFFIPVSVLVGPGAVPGEGLVAIGSTHGNEVEGPLAIKGLLSEIDLDEIPGRIILIPVLNVAAFQAGTRDTPNELDGVNLNRAFPGDAKGSYTYQVASFIHDQIFPHVHVVLDVHSGGFISQYAPVASFHIALNDDHRAKLEATARGYGTPFVMVHHCNSQGLLTVTAEKMGKVVIGGEYGWGARASKTGVDIVRRGILNAANLHGQSRMAVPEKKYCPHEEQILLDATMDEARVLSPLSAEFEPLVECGDHVQAGDPVGALHHFDDIDQKPTLVHATQSGYVLALAWHFRVFQGQVICEIGKPISWMEG